MRFGKTLGPLENTETQDLRAFCIMLKKIVEREHFKVCPWDTNWLQKPKTETHSNLSRSSSDQSKSTSKVPIKIPCEGEVCILWFRSDLEANRWATQQVNQAWVTLWVSRVVFLGLVRSDLRYLKAYYQCLGIRKSSVSSVCIDFFRKMFPGRWKDVHHGFRSKIDYIVRRIDQPCLQGNQKTFKPCLPMCLKHVLSRLKRSEAGRI